MQVRALNTTRTETRKQNQALSEIRTHDVCDAGAVLSQLSYQSHMRAVVYGLALYMGTFRLGPSTVKMKKICPIVAIEWPQSLNSFSVGRALDKFLSSFGIY